MAENIPRRAFVVGTLGVALGGCASSGSDEAGQAEQSEEPESNDTSTNTTQPVTSESDGDEDDTPEDSDDSEDNSDDDADDAETHALTVRLEDDSGSQIDGTVVIRGSESRWRYGSTKEATVDARPGDYTISAMNYDLGVGSGEETVRVYEDTEVVVTLYELSVETLTVIAGPERLMAAPGVEVTVERQDGATSTKTTGEDGTAEFNLYYGRYEITAADDSGRQETTTVPVHRETEVTFEDFGSYEDIPTVTVTFDVGDALSEPLADIIIKGRATSILGMRSEKEFDDEVDFASAPTDEEGRATAEVRDSHRYEVWGVDAQTGEYYEPDTVHPGTGEEMDVHGDTEVSISFFDR